MSKTSAREAIISEITSWTPYRLASEAECATPDSPDSDGAGMLDSVRITTLELITDTPDDDDLYRINDDGNVDAIADGAPSIYTHEKWAQFVDLGAWQEDISDYIGEDADMDRMSSVALYIIAERLANVIIVAVQDAITEADDDDDDDDTDTDGN